MLLLTLILCLAPVCGVSAQELYNPPGNALPSEQTAQNISQLPSESSKPNLRYGPGSGDGGHANQETALPTGDVDAAILLGLSALSLIYIVQTKRRKRYEN